MATIVHSAGHEQVSWRGETRALVRLSVPLVLTNLGQIAMQTTDVLMIGRLGAVPLAASTLAVSVFFMLFIFGMGIAMATAPMIAQDLGRRPSAVREPRRTVRQGFWATLAVGLPSLLVLWQIAPILEAIGQDPDLIAGAEAYTHAAMWGLVPGLWFIVLRNFTAALERPRPALVITLIGIAVNAVADYVLIFGAFGVPAYGLVGAGAATAVSAGFLFVGLLVVVLLDRRMRRYYILGRFWRPDWRRVRDVFKLGLPIAITLTFEVSLFAIAAQLMGLIGVAQLAAHQIAIQIASVTFMVPMGLGQAATVRVGLAVGRGDTPGILRAGLLALGLGVGFMALMALVMVTLPQALTGLFLDVALPANAAVVEFAVTFLIIAALFQIVDGGQAIGAGALRGMKDTRWPMIFAGVGYWLIGLGGGIALAFGLELGGIGIWYGLAAGLAFTAVLMIGRFLLLHRRLAGTTT